MNEFSEQIDISKLRIDLGQQWNEIELEVFLKIFRQQQLAGVGRMQETLRQLGYQRTTTNLLSVYKKNKNFLESNQNCTAHDLYLILRDHYEQNESSDMRTIKKIKKNQNYRKSIPQKFDINDNTQDMTFYFSQTQCIDNQSVYDNKNISQNFCKWIQHEYFYSHLDYTYFSLNEFQQMLTKASIPLGSKSIAEWRIIKMAVGQPRRFSFYFLQQEMSKLTKYRSVIRNYLFDQNYPIHRDIRNLDLIHDIVRLAPFNVDQTVYAVHPICKHVHVGQILSTNLPTITIKFSQPELGVHKISDQNIQLEVHQQVNNFNTQNENKNTLISSIVQELDHYAAAFMIRILQRYHHKYFRKYALVGHLKQLSQRLQDEPTLIEDQEFKALYQWSLQQIKNFDSASKHVITKFRMRGLAGYSLQQVNNNLDKVLSMPLAYMERELDQNNVEPEEEKKNLEIKQIIHKQQDVYIQILFERKKLILNQIHYCSKSLLLQRRIVVIIFLMILYSTELKPLVSSLFGLLYTLNNSQDLNMSSNTHWQTLKQYIQESHPQQLQEIQESILRIVEFRFQSEKFRIFNLLVSILNDQNIVQFLVSISNEF
ncbi:unnamed protein product (macronuclear) [Paramecium tetraurelia]|uniref:DIRP domain-containing protein n=1 Tax=Paramecium tetraurelia TaxID=5888 RepID=A0BQT2_PARTE|nr:uncharacterized protein GSPATT00031128001 [Paramecium tetraurelia]CAK60899.1 unnamed protein product [Paramecium tetraurelia]|eukprot:XP_001428297.1 hypothetical protein (macronuclear) [Paramecium tetraurelia strain d4-2]